MCSRRPVHANRQLPSGSRSSSPLAPHRSSSTTRPSRKHWGTCSEVHEMPDISIGPGLIALAVTVLLLIVIAVSPESLVNAIGQIFQLLGRLIGALAGEAEAGANALFGVVRGVFNPRVKSQQLATQATASQPSSASSPSAA